MAQSTSNASKTEKPGNRPAHTIRYGAVHAGVANLDLDQTAVFLTVKCSAKPVSVMFSAIASCGIKIYRHSFPPFDVENCDACSHHVTAASRFAMTSGSAISFFAFGSSM